MTAAAAGTVQGYAGTVSCCCRASNLHVTLTLATNLHVTPALGGKLAVICYHIIEADLNTAGSLSDIFSFISGG